METINSMLDKDIITVENPVYQTRKEIYTQYKGLHFIVTNITPTEPGEPSGWIGGLVRFHSKNYNKMSDLMMEVENITECGDSLLSYGGDDIGSLGAMLV